MREKRAGEGVWPSPADDIRGAPEMVTVCRQSSGADAVPTPRSRAAPPGSASAQSWRVNSASMSMVILSPTTTPPLSIGISMSTPNSLRLICVEPVKPARVRP